MQIQTFPIEGKKAIFIEWEKGETLRVCSARKRHSHHLEREIFIDNLLVRVHWIIEMIVVARPCAIGV